MADIKPMLNELKNKIPTKAQILSAIETVELQIDKKKLKENAEKVQERFAEIVEKASENPVVKGYATNILSSDLTNKAMLKLKTILPNQELIEKVDQVRLAYLKQNQESPKTSTKSSKQETTEEETSKE